MSVLVWIMVGIAIWHFAVLVPDRFWGGIVGAFLAAVAGAMASGYVLPVPGIPIENPPGIQEGLYALPGSLAALALSYWYGSRREAADAVDETESTSALPEGSRTTGPAALAHEG